VVLQLVITAPATGQAAIDSLFPARPAGFLTDVAGVVAAPEATRIEDKIRLLRERTGAEIAVVTLATIGDRAAVDVAVAIGRAWGVGAAAAVGDARRNAGVVVLLVPRREGDPNSGQIFIATGQGVEGFVTDAAAGRVRDRMRPMLAAGEYGEGLVAGVDDLAALIASGLGVTDSTLVPPRPARGPVPAGLIVALVIIAVIVVSIIIAVVKSGGGGPPRRGTRRPRRRNPGIWGGMGGGFGGGGFGGGGFGGGGGGFGGFGGGGGFSGGGAGGRF
jgi:uncharacterized protein